MDRLLLSECGWVTEGKTVSSFTSPPRTQCQWLQRPAQFLAVFLWRYTACALEFPLPAQYMIIIISRWFFFYYLLLIYIHFFFIILIKITTKNISSTDWPSSFFYSHGPFVDIVFCLSTNKLIILILIIVCKFKFCVVRVCVRVLTYILFENIRV